jgi:putative lipoic acid-binding regulatory protein
MTEDTPKLEELVEFPADFTFRVVAADAHGLAERLRALVAGVVGREPHGVSEQPSRKGNWRSVRITARVESADEIRAAYAALKEVPGVRMLL